MGVTIGNTGVSMTCTGFYEFRKALAKEIGIDLDEMDGFGITFQGGQIVQIEDLKSWEQIPDPGDPLVTLLNHSDVDGELGVAESIFCGERLEEIAGAWPDDHLWKQTALVLGEKLVEAGTIGERSIFHQ